MPAYNFKAEFAPLVESGQKRQTIRKKRKRPTKVGDMLYLKAGMRTKQCRDLGKGICFSVREVLITEVGMELDGAVLFIGEQYKIARDDGFNSIDEFRAFFRKLYGLPFKGVLLEW